MTSRIAAFIVIAIVAATFIFGLMVGAQRDDRNGPADLIVVNGKVYTGDPGLFAEAVAVRGNQILRVGTNREIKQLRRPQTAVIDARGGSVLPGFDDAHLHFISGGLDLETANLLEALTLEQTQKALRTWAEAHPNRPWVLGSGWSYGAFPGGLPTRQQLDALVPDRPAYIECFDGHTAWANTRALRLAGITRATPDPKNGEIVRDPRTGEPTGALKEAAKRLMDKVLPQPRRTDRLQAIRSAMAEAHRYGVTSVQNAGGSVDDLELFDELRRTGELKVRVYLALSVSPGFGEADAAQFEQVRNRFGDDPLLKTGAVKLFIDGVVEAHTAVMLASYADAPATGRPIYSQDELNRIVSMMDARGWQVMIHAIGDGGVRMALDAFEQAARVNPVPARGRRHRIEHIETIDPADIPRFGTLGVIAVQQPYHASPVPSGMQFWLAAVGPERASRGWALASIRNAGGHLAMGSDWSVVSIDPRLEIHMAVNRTTPGGEPRGGWLPQERIPTDAAIDAYTSGAAYASFDERRKGRITRGMLADLVVLSADVFSLPPERLLDAAVNVTIFDGKVVYHREPIRAQ